MNSIVGEFDIVFITLDTLRFDVAQRGWREGRTPFLASLLPATGWERRHTPANFTFAAHQAFFAGFLPTPVTPGPHPRLFAAAFPGSETTASETWRFDEATLVSALANRGYRTICVGGVGFFNKLTALGQQLPDLFCESHWSPQLGVTCPDSTANQATVACERAADVPADQPLMLFMNVSALHQPNLMYLAGACEDSVDSQLEALAYVDGQLEPLFAKLRQRRPIFGVICSDHGTAYGEDGYLGHRLNHDVVGDVPYIDFCLSQDGAVTWNPL